jgi:hypothetical protein
MLARTSDEKEQQMNDVTEAIRRRRLVEINLVPCSREALEIEHGQVWDTSQLADDFEVIGFMAPYVVVRRSADDMKGSLEFQHDPRPYFGWHPHDK